LINPVQVHGINQMESSMNKTLMICAAVTGISFIVPAAFADTMKSEIKSKTTMEKDEKGNYDAKRTTTSESVDSSGTLNKTDTTVKVDVDADGDASKTVTTENVVDPKGLLNKNKTVTKDVMKNKNGQTELRHVKKINGDTVENTKQSSDTSNY
jgi:hypothetical protein